MGQIFLPTLMQHRIVTPWLFGPGTDGDVTLDGIATPPTWSSYSTSRYTLNRHIFCHNLTIEDGIKLIPNGYGIFVSGTLDGNTSGSIFASGECTGMTAPGTVPCAANFFAAGLAGTGDFSTNRDGIAGTDQSDCLGGSGGDSSGNGGAYNGALGGVATGPGYTVNRTHLLAIIEAILASGSHPYGFNAGCSGAAGAAGTGNSGAGGSGGSEIGVFARHIAGSSWVIQADGSIAGYDTGSQYGTYGGGGGGGGGIIWFATQDTDYAIRVTLRANGGARGLGYLTNGTAGSAGTIVAAVF